MLLPPLCRRQSHHGGDPPTSADAPPPTARVTEMQYCSPEGAAQSPLTQAPTPAATQEEGTPPPPPSIHNWRPISLQLTLYKLYSAIIARRIASWAIETKAVSPAQKGFLTYDGCAQHNFLLRSVMLEARRNKRNLLLAWLDLRDAFGSVPHDLILLMMKRLGLSGSTLDIVKNIYSQSTIAIRTGRDTCTPTIAQNRGVKQGCPTEPNSLQHRVGGAPEAPSHQRSRVPAGRIHHQFPCLRG